MGATSSPRRRTSARRGCGQQHLIGLTCHYRGYASARHIAPAQVSIPPRPAPDACQSDPVIIDPHIEGWAYATPLKVPAR